MRRVKVATKAACPGGVYRVVRDAELAGQWQPDLRFFVLAGDDDAEQRIGKLQAARIGNVVLVDAHGLDQDDVVSYDSVQQRATVLYRASDVHHSLFMTNRCNSYCLMCSQPPTRHEDGWLVDQALDVIRHVRVPPVVIGISGGEPLLVAPGLKRVLDAIAQYWPKTLVEILTNGRLLSTVDVERLLLSEPLRNASWLVPLYGHADFLHDFVVQSPGAFDETLDGLLTLQSHGQPIQLRVVLIQPVIDVLDELCRFIGQNLPFVACVALMACEPTGFALANRELCELDLVDAQPTLERASALLDRYQVPHFFMNAPLCALPPGLWPKARKSISDWKNVYAEECSGCAVRERCCGLFAWHEQQWKPTKLKPVKEAAL